MNLLIKRLAHSFVFDIVSNSNIKKSFTVGINEQNQEYVRFEDPSHKRDDSNYAYAFPIPALAKDDKFKNLLKEIKSNFENGCKNFGLWYSFSFSYLFC